jgi:hypothetical protein
VQLRIRVIRVDDLEGSDMTLTEVVDGATQLSTLALDLASVSDPGVTAGRVIDLAVKLIPCVAVDVVRVTAVGELQMLASSDPGLSQQTLRTWHRWPHFPLSDAVQGPCRSDNHGSGYPAALLADCGIVSELMFALRVGDTDHGYLRFLFHDNVSPSSTVGRLAAAFSAQAAIALDRAALQMSVMNLRKAIDTNRDISAAVGILMAQQGINYPDAYQLLRSVSQNTNRKLRNVAAEILHDHEPNTRRPVSPGVLTATGPVRDGTSGADVGCGAAGLDPKSLALV